jgi:hypothetical protein
LYRRVQLFLFDAGLFEKLVLCFGLLHHHFHHHHHLTLLRLGVGHTVLHHSLHGLHLYVLLDFESGHHFLFAQQGPFIASAAGGLLLHLHDLHPLLLILPVVHGIPLEFLLRETNLFNYFHKFSLD